MSTSLNNIGHMSYLLGDHDTAEAHYRRALDIQGQLGDHEAMALTLRNLDPVAGPWRPRGRRGPLSAVSPDRRAPRSPSLRRQGTCSRWAAWPRTVVSTTMPTRTTAGPERRSSVWKTTPGAAETLTHMASLQAAMGDDAAAMKPIWLPWASSCDSVCPRQRGTSATSRGCAAGWAGRHSPRRSTTWWRTASHYPSSWTSWTSATGQGRAPKAPATNTTCRSPPPGQGDLMRRMGQDEEAARLYRRWFDIALRLAEAEPDRADYQRDLAAACNALGDVHGLWQAEARRQPELPGKSLDIRPTAWPRPSPTAPTTPAPWLPPTTPSVACILTPRAGARRRPTCTTSSSTSTLGLQPTIRSWRQRWVPSCPRGCCASPR